VILNPMVDLPAWIPVVGQMDVIALTVVTVRTFNSQAPKELRAEIEAEIRAGQSRFDLDLRHGATGAQRLVELLRRLPQLTRNKGQDQPPRPLPSQPAAWYRSPASAGGRTGELGAETEPEWRPSPATEEHLI